MVFDADATHGKIAKGLEECCLGSCISRGGSLLASGAVPLNLHIEREGPFLEMNSSVSRAAEEGDIRLFHAASEAVSEHAISGWLYRSPVLTMRESY